MIEKLLEQIRSFEPKYHIDDFKGLRVIENNAMKPHEIIVMVGSEVARQLKNSTEPQAKE